MKRLCALLFLLATTSGCGGDDDDVAEVKKALPLDKVPAAVLKAAKEADPSLTFFAAYEGKFDGKDAIELKGKTKTGKIREIEVSPDGKVLGTE
jgi:hypothetical protein